MPWSRELELAGLLGVRAGERALLVAEELALEQLARERGAVDLHERPRGAVARRVDAPRDDVLADAALADEQHRHVGVGDPVRRAPRPAPSRPRASALAARSASARARRPRRRRRRRGRRPGRRGRGAARGRARAPRTASGGSPFAPSFIARTTSSASESADMTITGSARVALADAAQHLEPVRLRDDEVEQHRVRAGLRAARRAPRRPSRAARTR